MSARSTSCAPHGGQVVRDGMPPLSSMRVGGSCNRDCVRTVSDAPGTPGKEGDIRGHSEAHRCCEKSLMESALVHCGVRQCAWPESISKRAPSTTRTSLRLSKSTTCERPAADYRTRRRSSEPFLNLVCTEWFDACENGVRGSCVRPSNFVRSLTVLSGVIVKPRRAAEVRALASGAWPVWHRRSTREASRRGLTPQLARGRRLG
jgi:hypothetical protein